MAEDTTFLLQSDEIVRLLERGEAAGIIDGTELGELLDALEVEPPDIEALHRELEERGIEVIETPREPAR